MFNALKSKIEPTFDKTENLTRQTYLLLEGVRSTLMMKYEKHTCQWEGGYGKPLTRIPANTQDYKVQKLQKIQKLEKRQ